MSNEGSGITTPEVKAAHSKIGASSMYRWSECPGSVRECEGIDSVSSPYAVEGTNAHRLAEILIRREIFGTKISPEDYAFMQGCSQEMQDAVDVYVDYVVAHNDEGGKEISIEHRFDLSSIHPGLYGTADCVIWNPKTRHLIVADYKHGAGIPVSPVRNSQLLYYGLGALLTLGYRAETVEVVVIQPRCAIGGEKIRGYGLAAFDLLEFAGDLKEFAVATEKPDAPLKSGDHCGFCPASAVCPELKGRALRVAQTEFTKVTASNPKELGELLDQLDRIEGFCKAVRAHAYKEGLAGRMPQGYKLVEKRGARQWINYEPQTIEALQKLGFKNEDIFEKPSLKSPPQFEKCLKNKAQREEVLGQLVKSVSSGVTLVSESDPRPSVITTAQDDFSALPDGGSLFL